MQVLHPRDYKCKFPQRSEVNSVVLDIGPAHALYFRTYEFGKDLFGANSTQGHHRFAIGMFLSIIKFVRKWI